MSKITPASEALAVSMSNIGKLSFDDVVVELEKAIKSSSSAGQKDGSALFTKSALDSSVVEQVKSEYVKNGYQFVFNQNFSNSSSQIILIWG